MEKINIFKAAHKGYVESSAEKTYIKDLRNDIHTIETEKNHVLERIGKIQFRLDKVLHKDVLEKSQILRQEKNREKQINNYIKDHNVERHREKMIQNQLKKELANSLATQNELTPEFIMQNIEEEAEVMKFLVKQKLPKELQLLKKKYQKLENISRMSITREYTNTLRNQVEQKSNQLQNLMEKLPTENSSFNDSQKSTVFRQQVAAIVEKKETAAELLNNIVFGDAILRGEELKQYVDKLKSKNLTYKQNRTELSSIRAEVADLMKMLEDLKSQEPNISVTIKQSNSTEELLGSQTSISGKGLTEILRTTEALKRAVNVNRDQLAPLTQRIKPLRERIEELKDESDSKKQFYNSVDMTLQTEISVFESKIREKEEVIVALEQDYKKFQLEYERAEFLLKKIQDTRSSKSNSKSELKEDMQKQIYERENLFKYLEQQAQALNNNQRHYKKQQELWNALNNILKIKLSCLKEIEENEKSGTLSIQKNIETFILN
ncbi:intraflagellar transport protein 81 homolog [Condylostylus longicornis]|uniref:intraflagellar transport protein 81 homolog n=1 Tax=Condylostylus longicornis TaxID=2530218 RepID=UPI00244E007E|nr:intraflagellar transport protein 81 homolog [Condylostylus longicornis]